MAQLKQTLTAFAIIAAGAGISIAMASQTGHRRKALAFWLGWLVPGLGHLVLGRAKKAAFFFGATGSMFLFGLWVCGGHTVSFDDNPFYFVGQFGSGMTMLLGQVLGLTKAHPGANGLPVSWYDPGLLYICVAGLLNVVIMLSVFTVAEPKAAPAAPPPAPEVKA